MSLISTDAALQTVLPANIFHHLGQYSPWFSAESVIDSRASPGHCTITFVSQLERHGSRYPTNGAYKELRKVLRKVAKHLQHVSDQSELIVSDESSPLGLDSSMQWLRSWTDLNKDQDGGLRNRLGNSELTPYGQYEAYSSGRRFSEQYAHLFAAGPVDVNDDYDAARSRGGVAWLCALPFSESSRTKAFAYVLRKTCSAVGYGPSASHAVDRRPFVRASGADRVVATSRFWLQGFSKPRRRFQHAPPESVPWPEKGRSTVIGFLKSKKPQRPIRGLPQPDLIISEARKADKLGQGVSNNTLDVYTCLSFERDVRGNAHSLASRKVESFAKHATVPVQQRLARLLGERSDGSKDRRGKRLYLSYEEILQLFSLCAFDTVARLDPYGLILNDAERNKDSMSPFCTLFKPAEFQKIYDVTTSIDKDYGFASRQPFHKALATPWLRELVARLEGRKPVMDPPTSINCTLDSSATTFPLPTVKGPHAFVDFTHDNQLAPIIASLNLWDSDHGWQASTTTPFSGRLAVERLQCGHDHEEKIRILVNDAAASTSKGTWCPSASHEYLCPLSSFLSQLAWVETPNEWSQCYN